MKGINWWTLTFKKKSIRRLKTYCTMCNYTPYNLYMDIPNVLIRPISKKNSFRGNYSRKYGKLRFQWIIFARTRLDCENKACSKSHWIFFWEPFVPGLISWYFFQLQHSQLVCVTSKHQNKFYGNMYL